MNILPKKSWHVRTWKNIQRVRRDEEKAAKEEKERQRKIALAEQEARTELLRNKSRKRTAGQLEGTSGTAGQLEGTSGDPELEASHGDLQLEKKEESATSIYTAAGHMNFFKDIEEGLRKDGKNEEHEKEKKAEKEKWEKNMGILTYLGQSSMSSEEKSWYLTKRKKPDVESDLMEKDRKLKDRNDPLRKMNSYLEKKKHKEGKGQDKHKSHKHKHRHKDRPRDKAPQPSSSKTMEQLRAERLRREQEERQRSQALLAKVRGEGSSTEVREEVEVSERDMRYNSQFNPDFVRKPRHRHSYDKY